MASMVTLDDNQKYIVLDEIAGNNKYVYLMNADDDNIFVVRKEIEKDGKTFLEGLETDEEFNEALSLYIKKDDK